MKRLVFIIILILIFLLAFAPVVNAECLKQISVQEVTYRSNPNVFQKVVSPYIKGEKKKVWIDCELYDSVKVGDELAEPGDPVDRIRLFGGDNGVLERKRYIVLKK